MKAKLSERVVKAAEIGSRKYVLFDEDTPGFGLCVYTTGRKGFVLIYRIAGQQKRFTIGVWPTWSVTAARDEAKRLIGPAPVLFRSFLRSKRYVTGSGRDQGGQILSRGHIHKILTNPLYIGKVRHKTAIHDGQHPAIIPEEQWTRVQVLLQDQSAVRRGQGTSGRPTAPLAGRLFDHEGERLTPVHTQKCGRRYEYYISQSLKTGAASPDRSSGWRLPARALEDRVATAVRRHLRGAVLRELAASLAPGTTTEIAARIGSDAFNVLAPIERVVLHPDRLAITLSASSLAAVFEVPVPLLEPMQPAFEALFTLTRRGVEARIVLDGDSFDRDNTLLANIARGHAFLKKLTGGASFQEVASASGLSVKRVQQILEFAFLSPTLVTQVAEARQPSLLTGEWCLRHEIPADWMAQEALFRNA